MNLALRILGVAIFVAAGAIATVGAFQAFDTGTDFTQVELSAPGDQPVRMLAGGSTSVSFGLQNTGDTAENLTLRSASDGFRLSATDRVVSVQPGGTTSAEARLSVDPGILGTRTVEVQAVRDGGDATLASTTVQVRVIEGGSVGLELSPNLPAVIPGENLTLQGEVTNPVSTAQTLNFTLSGVQGTVEPQSTQVQPNGTATVTVTVPVPSTASGSVDLVLQATNEANDTSSASASVPVLAEGEVAVGAVVDEAGIKPGNDYAVPILVVSNQAEPAEVTASGDHVTATDFDEVDARSSTGGFATLTIPESASGTLTETITVTVGEDERSVEVQVDTSPPGDEATTGKQVTVDYVGRLVNGSVFDTSLSAVAQGPFEKGESFRQRPGLQPIQLTLNPQRPGVIPGFFDALQNMSENESRTVRLSPSEAYGPVRTHENISATSEIERVNEVPRLLEDIPKQQLPASFDIENKTEGDVITFETESGDTPVTFEFELLRKGNRTVDLQRLAEEGDTTTFYGPWPNATEVTFVNETLIRYTTTPPDEPAEFTWDVNPNSPQAEWENATTVQSMNETTIVLLHQPEEGLEYNASSGPRSPPQTYTVDEVTMDEIHVSTPNSHPLGGKTLIFDMTLLEVSDPPQRRSMPIGGGR